MYSLDPPASPTPDPEPAYCPRCKLRHTRREDWLCPRCGSPVDTDVPPPEVTTAPRREEFPLSARIAGGVLVLASGASGWAVGRDLVSGAPGAHRWPLLAAAATLAALGVALLLKVSLARWIAVAVAAVAAVVVAEGLLRDLAPGLLRDPLPGVARQVLRDLIPDHRPAKVLSLLALDAGALLLLLGRPGRIRLVAGVLLALPLLVLEVAGALGR